MQKSEALTQKDRNGDGEQRANEVKMEEDDEGRSVLIITGAWVSYIASYRGVLEADLLNAAMLVASRSSSSRMPS